MKKHCSSDTIGISPTTTSDNAEKNKCNMMCFWWLRLDLGMM